MSKRAVCTPASHEALKADAVAWAALPAKPDWIFGTYSLQLRDCPRCQTTLAIAAAAARAAA